MLSDCDQSAAIVVGVVSLNGGLAGLIRFPNLEQTPLGIAGVCGALGVCIGAGGDQGVEGGLGALNGVDAPLLFGVH